MTDAVADPLPPARTFATRADLLARLEALGITTWTYDHEPIFTVGQGAQMKRQWPGGHSKNLFLKDKKGTLVLLCAKDDTDIPLKHLHKGLGTGRLSFAAPDLMEDVLGVTPGSVTAFALINAAPGRLAHILFDAALMACDPVHFHPLQNTATTAIAPADLMRFARACGHAPVIQDFTALSGGEI
ncbi:MAG: prolyl-tRNA synthetase associated domain-containing protein [Alphaproteobacteria bacterium]